MRLDPPPELANRLAGEVTAVEYHGPFVRVGLQDQGGADHSLLLSEADFFARPVALGDRVTAGFAAADAHILYN